MTHEELLAKIEDTYNGEIDSDWVYSALRAVLKLHKPEHSIRGYRCVKCDELFPCIEFQTIEKELK